MPTYSGTIGNDVLVGGSEEDVFLAYSGDDIIRARGGEDRAFGGSGDDTIWGGRGVDSMAGGTGDDIIYGSAGADTLSGGAGDNSLYGGHGADFILSQGGADQVFGGAGRDDIYGSFDVLSGNGWLDAVDGGAGYDRLTLVARPAADDPSPLRVSWDGEVVTVRQGDVATTVETVGIEEVFVNSTQGLFYLGTGADDRLTGGVATSRLYGQGGDDVLSGYRDAVIPARDYLYGGRGQDLLTGRAGDDVLVPGRGRDEARGGLGRDTFVFGGDSANDLARGGQDVDRFVFRDAEMGHDRITDFRGDLGEVIRLTFAEDASAIASITQEARGVVIRFDAENAIILKRLTLEEFSAEDHLIFG